MVQAGFGQVEVRARRPYRLLDCASHSLDSPLLLESLDSVSFKVPIADDGACIFTGETAIYTGTEAMFDDGAGHVLHLIDKIQTALYCYSCSSRALWL
jgi:hypothetical protein